MNTTAPCGERRGRGRRRIKAAAFVLRDGKYHGSYHVENLSAAGATFTGRSPIGKGEAVVVLLQLTGYPSMRIRARGVHCEGPSPFEYSIGLAFQHDSPDTEKVLNQVDL